MTVVDPQPGDWVLIRAKVVERPIPENMTVELFSKTDQYTALVRTKMCVQIVPKPIPDEPGDGSVVLACDDQTAYQRYQGSWLPACTAPVKTWSELHDLGEVTVIHHA